MTADPYPGPAGGNATADCSPGGAGLFPYPGMKAVEALGLLLPFYLLLFASTYFVMERAWAASFTEPLTRTDALYFSVTVFSTVGFGDIAPKSEAARIVLIVQMLGDLAQPAITHPARMR